MQFETLAATGYGPGRCYYLKDLFAVEGKAGVWRRVPRASKAAALVACFDGDLVSLMRDQAVEAELAEAGLVVTWTEKELKEAVAMLPGNAHVGEVLGMLDKQVAEGSCSEVCLPPKTVAVELSVEAAKHIVDILEDKNYPTHAGERMPDADDELVQRMLFKRNGEPCVTETPDMVGKMPC